MVPYCATKFEIVNNTLVTLSLMMKFDLLLMVSAPVVSVTQQSADTSRSTDSDSSHRIHNIEDILQTISSDDNVSSSNHSEGQGHTPGQGHSLSQLSEQSSSPSRAGEMTQGRQTLTVKKQYRHLLFIITY